MQDRKIKHLNKTKHSEQKEQSDNLLIINSFSKNIMYAHKKYMTSRKIIYTKNCPLKNNKKTESSDNIYDANKSPSVVNLQFQEGKNSQNIKGIAKRWSQKGQNQQKRTNYSTIEQASKRIVNIYRQNTKQKYDKMLKDSVDDFFQNTLQIGSYVKCILKQNDIADPMCYRKLINAQKVAFPMRQTRAQNMRNKTNFIRINQTTRLQVQSASQSNHKRLKSYIDSTQLQPDQGTFSDRRPQSLHRKKQKPSMLQALIPIRKPNLRKDYFVFGLTDRTGTAQNKIQMYRDMLWKINYSNCLFVFTPQTVNNPNQSYKFYVGPGNNGNLIKGILKRRFWWSITTNKNEDGINFLWTQLKVNQFFRLQKSNQIPIVQKYQKTGQKLGSSSQNSIVNIQSQFPDISRIFNTQDIPTWLRHYKQNQKSQRMIQQNTYKKRIKLYEKKPIIRIQDSNQLRMHNHLQFNYYVGNKKALFYSIKRFYQLQNKDPFKIIPHTFHIKKGVADAEWKNFLKYHQEMQLYKKSLPSQKNSCFRNMWICKPGQNTNRGNGITVCYSLDDMKIRLNGRQKNRDGQLRTFILQKYIQNPMLYQKRKFDIRHYALICCINGIFKFYWYEEGYIRTSSSQFNLKVNRDPLIHLTNDAIQKNTPDYGKYQKGNKLSYFDFQKYLQTTYPTRKYSFFEQVLPRMKQYATEAFKSSYSILDQKRLGNNFELLGLDFMIDENFQPWLIQINTNPCLQLSSPLLSRIIPHLIQNVCRLCLDPLFPPPQHWPANKKLFFSEDPLSQNKFTLVFDQTVHGKQIQQIFKGHKKIDMNMGKIQQQDQTYQDEGKQDWQQKNITPNP